jgi:general secretion pathway protein L
MAESLYLHLPRAAGPARWLLVDSLGNRIGHVQQGPIEDALPFAKGRRVTVLMPGEQVTLLHVDVPSRNPQKVLQAVPFMLEDKLAEDVESLHFALGDRTEAGQLVAVVSRARMQSCLDTLAAAGIAPRQLIPDVCALVPEPGTAAVALDGDAALVRFAEGGGFATDLALGAPLLKRRAFESGGALTRVELYGTESDIETFDATLGDASLERVKHPNADGALPALAAELRGQRGLDLLQGDFRLQTPLQEHWHTWRVAAILLALCLLLGFTEQITSYVRLRHQAAALDSQVAEFYTQATGSPVPEGTDALTAMKSKLRALQGGSSAGSLLALLDALGDSIGGNASIQITGFNYQGGNLQVQVQAGDIGALDALKGALNQQAGVRADLDSVNAAGSQVTGRLVLSGGGA